MSKKRRRSRPRGQAEGRAASTAVEPERPSRTPAGPFPRGTFDTPFPPIRTALARGFVTVGASTGLLAAVFAVELVRWVGLVILGFEGPPGPTLLTSIALPPINTAFDLFNAQSIFGAQLASSIALLAFFSIDSVVLALFAAIVVQRLEGDEGVGDALRRGARAIPIVLTAQVIAVSGLLLGNQILPILGGGLAFLGQFAILLGLIFFLANVPIAAVRLRVGIQETIRRAGRAGILPGSRHLLLCVLYFFVTYMMLPVVFLAAPEGARFGVNPSIGVWVIALVASFIHLGFLAAFAYRWIAAEDDIPTEPVRIRRPR